MKINIAIERKLLQIAIALAGIVPVSAGLAGALLGPGFLGAPGSLSADSHFRYLSGLLLGIGLAFWASIRRVERRSARITLLSAIVVLGGLARLFGIAVKGPPGPEMLFALGMELIVTPGLWIWQRRVAALMKTAT